MERLIRLNGSMLEGLMKLWIKFDWEDFFPRWI